MSKFIFIHINKCGGTSFKQTLKGVPNVIVPSNDQIVNLVKKDVWKESYTFTIVRNPYHRLLSLHGMLVRDRNEKSIDEILNIISNDDIKYISNSGGLDKKRKEYIKRHGLPMTHKHYGIYDNDKNVLNVNKFYKLENLENEWSHIEELLGKKLHVYNINKSNSKKDLSFFTKQQIEKINQIYSKDFEVFGYDKINL